VNIRLVVIAGLQNILLEVKSHPLTVHREIIAGILLVRDDRTHEKIIRIRVAVDNASENHNPYPKRILVEKEKGISNIVFEINVPKIPPRNCALI
jgi:hypothetical protein